MMVPKWYRILPGKVTRIYVALFLRFNKDLPLHYFPWPVYSRRVSFG